MSEGAKTARLLEPLLTQLRRERHVRHAAATEENRLIRGWSTPSTRLRASVPVSSRPRIEVPPQLGLGTAAMPAHACRCRLETRTGGDIPQSHGDSGCRFVLGSEQNERHARTDARHTGVE
jgi:hypothetical protein